MAEKPEGIVSEELLERFMSAAYEGKVKGISIGTLSLTRSSDRASRNSAYHPQMFPHLRGPPHRLWVGPRRRSRTKTGILASYMR